MSIILVKSVLRGILKHYKTNLFNVLSLSASIILLCFSSTLLVKELRINQVFYQSDDIYRVDTKILFTNGVEEDLAMVNEFAGPKLLELSGINEQTRIKIEKNDVFVNGRSFEDENIAYVDRSYFDIFNLNMLYGTTLKGTGKNRVVISQSIREKFFGEEDPINKSLRINETEYIVCGLYESKSSELEEDIIVQFISSKDEFSWTKTFIKLNSNSNFTYITEQIQHVLIDKLEGEFDESAMSLSFSLTPLKDVHFSNKLFDNQSGNRSIILIFNLFALLTFILSSINYLNLSILSSNTRAKNVTLKRILGAGVKHIVYETSAEIFTLFLISGLIAFTVIVLFTQDIIAILNLSINPDDLKNLQFIGPSIFPFMGMLFLTMFSGSFLNARISRSAHPKSASSSKNTYKYFLGAQAFICVGISTFAFIANKQLDLIGKPNMGYNYNNVYSVIFSNRTSTDKIFRFKQVISNNNGIESVSLINKNAIPSYDPDIQIFEVEGRKIPARSMFIDESYFATLGIMNQIETEKIRTYSYVINNSFKKKLNDKDFISINGKEIAGSVNDIYQDGIYEKTEPTVYRFDSLYLNAALIKTNTAYTLSDIDNVIKSLKLDGINNYELFELNELVMSEIKNDLNIIYFMKIATLGIYMISFIGIYTMANFIYNQNLKTICIKQILGANVIKIAFTLGKETLMIILIASLSVLPVIYILAETWLNRFEIKISNLSFNMLFSIIAVIALYLLFQLTIVIKIRNLDIQKILKQDD